MRARSLSFLPLLAALSGPALAWNETLETPFGVARAEGDYLANEPRRLLVGEREVFRTEDWYSLWPQAVVGDWLLAGVSEGGSQCLAQWMWIDLATGAQSEVFGTCAMVEEVRAEPDGSLTVAMYSFDPDVPVSNFVFDGSVVTEFRDGQKPAAVPPGAPADDLVGRYPHELFHASDWRRPLVELLGPEGYDLGQEAFGRAGPFEVEGDWVVAWGCMLHACALLEGRIAIHRGDGRILVALAEEKELPVLWGEPGGAMPPTVAELMAEF